MTFSEDAQKEMIRLSQSADLKREMGTVAGGRHNPFVKDGKVVIDAYLSFVAQYNEFIDHRPKTFKPMTGDRFVL